MKHRAAHRAGGFTLIELLLTSAIIGVIGAALVAALDASLMAYGTSTTQASMQTSGRLVVARAMSMIRNSSLHDAYDPAQPAQTLVLPTAANHPLRSVGIEFVQDTGTVVRLWWAVNADYGDADLGDLWVEQGGGTPQVLIARVRCQRDGAAPYVFTLASRLSDAGLLLERATLDLQVDAPTVATDTTTALENATAKVAAMRLISSTMPRRNLD